MIHTYIHKYRYLLRNLLTCGGGFENVLEFAGEARNVSGRTPHIEANHRLYVCMYVCMYYVNMILEHVCMNVCMYVLRKYDS